MAKGSGDAYGLNAKPDVIHAQMEKTRADLTQTLAAIKARIFGQPRPASKRKPAVAKKTSGTEKKASKKTSGHSRTAGTASKAKQMLTKVLKGAAVGALKGAVETVDTDKKTSPTGRKTKAK